MYFVRPLAEFHNKNYGTNLKEDDFFSYEFYDVWGGNYDDVWSILYIFINSVKRKYINFLNHKNLKEFNWFQVVLKVSKNSKNIMICLLSLLDSIYWRIKL